jgi:hypothetical protein
MLCGTLLLLARVAGNGHTHQVRGNKRRPDLEEPIATIGRKEAEQGRCSEQVQIADLGEVRTAE